MIPRIVLSCWAIVMLASLSGCATLRSNRSSQSGGPDTVYVTVEDDGYKVAVAGENVKRSFTLQHVGDEASFSLNEPVELRFGDIDPETETIETTIDHSTKTVQLRVVSRTKHVVRFEKKCQSVLYSTLSEIPNIEISSGLSPQQIIITPLCDAAGLVFAYEMRYGSEEQGCRAEAKPGLTAFKRCPGVISFRPVSIDRGSYFGRPPSTRKKR